MTNEEAIYEIESRLALADKEYMKDIPEYIEALNIAADLIRKQIPRKPVIEDNGEEIYGYCPCCGEVAYMVVRQFPYNYSHSYCGGCGQKIDWSEFSDDLR